MEAKKDYPRFDASGVKQHFRELDRQRWIAEGRREVVKWVEREFGVDWSEEKEQLKKWGIDSEGLSTASSNERPVRI